MELASSTGNSKAKLCVFSSLFTCWVQITGWLIRVWLVQSKYWNKTLFFSDSWGLAVWKFHHRSTIEVLVSYRLIKPSMRGSPRQDRIFQQLNIYILQPNPPPLHLLSAGCTQGCHVTPVNRTTSSSLNTMTDYHVGGLLNLISLGFTSCNIFIKPFTVKKKKITGCFRLLHFVKSQWRARKPSCLGDLKTNWINATKNQSLD